MGTLGLLEILEAMVEEEAQVVQVEMAFKETQESLEFLATLVNQDCKEQLVFLEIQVFRDLMDLQDQKGQLAFKVLVVLMVCKALQAIQALKGVEGVQVFQEVQVRLVLKEIQVQQEDQAFLA